MPSLAEQSVAELGGRISVLARQKADHIKLDRLLHRLDRAPSGGEGPVLRDIYRLVFPHAFAEESVLWPVIRRVLSDGHELTLRVEQEHQLVNELVTQLDGLMPGTSEHRRMLERLVELLREDVRDEEDVLLARLQDKLSHNQLRMLGIGWEAVRQIAPTRAHPIVARRPPGNLLSALPLTVLDRSRDRVEAVLDRGGAAAAPLRIIDAALAGMARAVEHLPGMRRGEDRSTQVSPPRRFPWATAAVSAIGAALVLGAAARKRSKPT